MHRLIITLLSLVGLIIPSVLYAQPRPHHGPHTALPNSNNHNQDDHKSAHHDNHTQYAPSHTHRHYNSSRYYTPIVPPPPHPVRYEYCYTRLFPIPHRVCEWRNYTPDYRYIAPHHHH